MKIGIFGGSFNPPHKMHKKMALELLDKHYIDKIIYVPTGSKYEYKHNLVNDLARLEMLKIMIQDDDRCSVSDFELKDHVVYTYQTLAYFKGKYPNDEIYFICGTDNLSYIDKWKNGSEILKNYKILVVRRDGDDLTELMEKFCEYRENIIISDVIPQELSSTLIREKIKREENIGYYLDKDVLEYIKENSLYED